MDIPGVIDSHAHVDFPSFDRDRVQVLARAWAAGLVALVNPGADLASSRRAVVLAGDEGRVWAAVGIHPHSADEWVEAAAEIRALAHSRRVVAVGETGLDYYRMLCPAVVQKEALRGHIRLARELGLPLILHCRDAHQDLFPLLREEKANEVGGVLHCFSGGEEEAARALDLGLYLGFTGTVTFPNAAPLRAVAAGIPLERLLVETDCPYLAPHPWRGKRNEPAYVVRVVETVAEVRGLTPAEVAGAAAANACRLFRHA